jgi:hypothetical protein
MGITEKVPRVCLNCGRLALMHDKYEARDCNKATNCKDNIQWSMLEKDLNDKLSRSGFGHAEIRGIGAGSGAGTRDDSHIGISA